LKKQDTIILDKIEINFTYSLQKKKAVLTDSLLLMIYVFLKIESIIF